MRTNEYYSKRRIALVVTSAVTIYSILTAMSLMVVKGATPNNLLDFTPNFDKEFRTSVAVSNADISADKTKKGNYSLSEVEYDTSTLYLDWSQIETERARLEKERKKEEALRKEKLVQIASASTTSARVNATLKTVGDSLSLPDILDTSFKGYMCIHKVTSTSSKQWKFLHSGDFELTTDSNGIMMYGDYYVVAMASYYTNYKVGSTFRITLDSGVVFDVITGDEKADEDTDSTRTFRPKGVDRGEIVEFIVACGEEGENCNEYHTMSSNDRKLGNLSSLGFQGNVVKIQKLNDSSVSDKLY